MATSNTATVTITVRALAGGQTMTSTWPLRDRSWTLLP